MPPGDPSLPTSATAPGRRRPWRGIPRAVTPALVGVTALAAVLGAQVGGAPVASAATQGLSLTATAAPTTVSRVGQQVDYTIAVRNRGDQSVRDLLVSAPVPGLSALVCSPVALGGVLAAGSTTTCRATRTVAVTDLAASDLGATVKATARPTGGSAAVNASVTVTVAVGAQAPAATSDSVPAVDGGASVVLPGATNDGPGASGGPAIDASRTVLVGGTPDPAYGAKAVTTAEGRWAVLPNGSVRFTPGLGHPGTTAQVGYRVYDVAGRSAVGQLRVPLRRGPVARTHALTTPQGKAVYVDLLKLDDPGQKADGTPAAFVRASLRLTGVSPTTGLKIDYIFDRSSIRIAGVGDFAVSVNDGLVLVYDASRYPYFTGTVPTLSYTALTTAGTSVNGTVTVEVLRTTGGTAPVPDLPEALPDSVTTTPQVPVVLAGQANDLSGVAPLDSSKLAFPTDQIRFLPPGTTITDVGGEQVLDEPGKGSFRTNRAEGTILFTPNPDFVSPDDIPGFLGSVVAEYTITDTAGNSSRAYLSAGLVPGAYAKPDAVTTRQGRAVNANVLVNDYAGRSQLAGSPGTFADPRLTTVGLPSGAKLGGSGSVLTVPGQGVYTVSPGNRTVTFVPEPTFRGKASLVTLALRVSVPRLAAEPATFELHPTLQVTVVGADTVAEADRASTDAGEPVVVAVLANDAPGSPVVPLVASSVRLRLAPGLPSGSTLSGDAKTLVVAGRGTFLVSGTGQVTFVPLGTATGAVPAIGYQVADVNGTTARSTLTVTVR